MRRILRPMICAATILALTAALAMAQTMPPAAPAASGTPGPAELSAPSSSRSLEELDEQEIDGPIKKIDPASHTIQVGWFLGLFRTTLEVTDDTHIAVGGMKASLSDIQEGAEVKASYEERDGKNIAKSIEVMSAAEEGTGAKSRAPASPVSPQ